jgi:hypothetical protein
MRSDTRTYGVGKRVLTYLRLAPITVASFFPLSPVADIAQLVEQVIRNDQVIGSSPIVGSRSEISRIDR